MSDITAVLHNFYSQNRFSISDGDYDTLIWYSDTPKPTRQELEARVEEARVADINQKASRQRHEAYVAEADPMFFKAQRGEATMEEWQAKVAEIKARFPKE